MVSNREKPDYNKEEYDMNSVFDRIAHFFNTPSKLRTIKLLEYGTILLGLLLYGIYELVMSILQ